MPKNKGEHCQCCNGKGKIIIIEKVARFGKYHLGKEKLKKCFVCKNKKNFYLQEMEHDINTTIH